MSAPLPFQLVITDRPVLLVGAGPMAEAKLSLLHERGAIVERWLQAPDQEQLAAAEQRNRDPRTRFVLVIVADEAPWARALVEWVESERLLLNVVDEPGQSAGFIPAIVSRGVVQIGIGTGGTSPVLARLIRTRIEQVLPRHLDRLGALASRWRDRVMATFPGIQERRLFWEGALSGPAADQALAGQDRDADQAMERLLASPEFKIGRVSLVGAGPGGVSLLTIKGLQRLQEADVVLYDKLVDPDILELARKDARFEDVGKRRGQCPIPQEAICDRLVELGRQGLNVCRLKGGDPYLFGRGGEEAIALTAAGIDVEVVPGITTASAVAASAGMPLTHRGLARSVRFVTGHLALDQSRTHWQALAARQETLVLYMGFTHIETIASELIAAGVPASLPMAAVQNGCRDDQRVIRTVLGGAAQLGRALSLDDGPILIVIGEVASLQGLASRETTSAADWQTTLQETGS